MLLEADVPIASDDNQFARPALRNMAGGVAKAGKSVCYAE
jgi:hypothetical protein